MKKLIIKTLSIVITVVMIVTVAFVPASAISESCLEDHFSKLNLHV